MVIRRPPHVVIRPDGTPAVQAKAPRADLLRYPHLRGQVTVLVRRTHDVDLARELAQARWLEYVIAQAAGSGVRCAIVRPAPLGRHRVGWWLTSITAAGPRRPVPRRGAVDEQGRVVVWCEDPLAVYAPGPGVEFLTGPATAPAAADGPASSDRRPGAGQDVPHGR
jgi:hypothetical protein